MDRFASLAPDPEQQASNSEVRRLLEEAVEKLPDAYRRGTGDQQRPLFDTVREKLDILNAPKNRKRLKRIDHTIRDTLLKEIDSHPDAQTRERLHLVIYNGKLPHYHKGQLEPMDDPDALKRHDWRHLINTFYNFNLAEKYRSRPVLNSKWFDIPRRLTTPSERVAASLKKIGEVKLETSIYPEYITVPFVASARREKDFWKTITRMEKAYNQGEYKAAFEDHLRFISSRFAQHLKDSGHADLVETPVAEVMMELLPKTVAYCALVEAAVGIWCGLPWKSLASASLTVLGGATLVVKNFIARLPIKVTNPHFKSFEAKMALVARKSSLTT